MASTLAALVPGAFCFAVPTALLLVVRPRRSEHTRLRALATWALLAASLTGLLVGLAWWWQVLIRIGLDNDDVRTWPSAFALPLLCMFAIAAALYALLMLGIGRDEELRDTTGS